MSRIAPIAGHVLAERRRRFQDRIGPGVAVLPGAKLARRSHDVDYVFRQNSDLLYLTGFAQPEAAAVLTHDRFVLFTQPRDPQAETWTGRRPGAEGAVERFGADEAHAIGGLQERLPGLLENRPRLYTPLGLDRGFDEMILAALDDLRGRARSGVTAPQEIVDPRGILHEMRLRKESAELTVMRAAAAISAEGHRAAARLCRPGAYEYELEAALHHVFRRRGGSGPAYPSIVGAGDNATILHYIDNDARLEAGQLVLIDAGAELHGYASDVTRTYPVGGIFTGTGRAVYEIVLEAQRVAIDAVQPGVPWRAPHEAALRVLVDGLVEFGALEGDPAALLEQEAYRPFYMHNTSHWLGLDVHDVGSYSVEGKPRQLEPGMVLTVEPGLYFSSVEEKSPPELRGIGVRIEDDVLVTDNGCEVLTAAVPKRIDDVEAWMRE